MQGASGCGFYFGENGTGRIGTATGQGRDRGAERQKHGDGQWVLQIWLSLQVQENKQIYQLDKGSALYFSK
jgi:hypothetical protein